MGSGVFASSLARFLVRARARAAPVAIFAGLLLNARAASAQSPPAAPETVAVGDWQLAPLLQVRTRGEYRRDPMDVGGAAFAGAATPRVRNAPGVFERSRIGLGADRGALRVQLTLQDARAWGSGSSTAILGAPAGNASFGAYEAYVEAHTSAARPSSIRIGRQAVTWGDGRLIGNADWSPTARMLDAVRGRLALGAWDFELLAAILESPHPLGVATGDVAGGALSGAQLYGAQVALALDPRLKLEASAIARVSRGTPSLEEGSRFGAARASGETYVGSLRVSGEGRGWRYAVEGVYELGRADRLLDQDVSAYAAAAYVEKKIDALVLAPTLRAAFELASGDDGGTGAYHQFDPILPDVHVLHGAMDVLAWSNTAQVSGRLSVVPWTDGVAGVEYRYARLASGHGEWLGAYLTGIGRPPGTGPVDTELGHEIDAFLTWRPWAPLHLATGYSLFVVGDGARAMLAARGRGTLQDDGVIVPSRLSHFGYLQLTVDVP